MRDFVGQVVLVTGGGTGIGRATCECFARHGAQVVVNYSRSEREAQATADGIVSAGGKAVAICADISRDHEVRQLIAATLRHFGRLDVLVNNAGFTEFVPYRDLEGLTEDIWDRVLAVNLKGAFFASRAAINVMLRGEGGQIVNVSSLSAMTGQGSSIAYAASKAALVNMTQALAYSHAPRIRVNAVAPGVVETRWIAGKEDFVEVHRNNTPLDRLAAPDDIAQAIYSLATNSYVTGQTWIVDGGRILQH